MEVNDGGRESTQVEPRMCDCFDLLAQSVPDGLIESGLLRCENFAYSHNRSMRQEEKCGRGAVIHVAGCGYSWC